MQGIFEGREVIFQEEDVKGDGDCGFHAIGVSRDEAVEQLKRELLEEKILERLLDKKLSKDL